MVFGYFLSPGAISGTVAVIAGVVAVVAKNREDGKAWFANKFGEKWAEKIWLKFFGLPLIAVGILMWVPDHWWFDVAKFVGGWVIFIGGYMYWQKRQAAKKKVAEEAKTDTAADAATTT